MMLTAEKNLFRSALFASFLSGFASLIYQVVWQRVISQEIGVDLIATKVVVVDFLLGLAVGYYYGKRLSFRAAISYSKWFAIAEIVVGLLGLIYIPALRSIKHLFPSPGIHADLLFGSFLLLIPTFFMGLSTPMLVGAARQFSKQSGEIIGRLYGVNVLGAAAGAALSGFVLIECFGLYYTSVLACLANFGAAYSIRKSLSTSVVPEPAVSTSYRPLAPRLALAAIFLGFASLTFEMAAFRSIFYFFGLASYQFPLLLSGFLVSMAIGEMLGGKLCSFRKKLSESTSVNILLIMTTVALAGSYFISHFPPTELAVGVVKKRQLLYLAGFAAVFMAPVIFISSFFPILVEKVSHTPGDLPRRVALLLFLSTLANAAGGFVASFWILPKVGTDLSLVLVMFLVVTSSLLISPSKKSFGLGIASLAAVLSFWHPYFHREDQLELIESKVGVFDVVRSKKDEVQISLSRTPTAAAFTGEAESLSEQAARWSMKDLWSVTDLKPKKALVIGLGHGLVVEHLAKVPSMEKIVVIELFSEVRDLVLKYSSHPIRSTLESDKVSILLGDGRKLLQKMDRDEKFDVIQLTVFHPWTSGASNLYTKEFLSKVSRHLTSTGVLALVSGTPLLTATANSVFPYNYRLKSGEARHKFDYYSMQPLTLRDQPSSMACLGAYKEGPWQVRRLVTQKKHVNTDDSPLLEYFAFRQVVAQLTGLTIRPHQDNEPHEEPIVDYNHDPCST